MARWLLIALIGCARATGAPSPSPSPSAPHAAGPVVAHAGEAMEFEVRLRGLAIGTLQVAVGRPGWVDGHEAIIVRSRGSSGGLLALFTRLTWELTTTLDLQRGLPIEATGESTVTFDGKTEHERVAEHWTAGDTHHDLHSLGAALRAWRLPPGLRAGLWFWLGGGHFQLTVWDAGRDYVAAAHTRAVRFEGIVEEEYHFAVWISDDALRVPVAVEADTKWGKVTAALVDYDPRATKGIFQRLIGTHIGTYVVVAELGTGGMGEVYRAVTPAQKHVAIKVLRASCASDSRARERLIREAQAVNRIDSRGVAKVTDAGALADGRPYIVMELLEGEGLDARLKRAGRPPIAESVRVLLDVLEILEAAHRAAIVHRDLKPANVFSTAERTFVLDFGLAKLLDADGGALTSTGAVVGTPYYIAPEQIESRPLDARTDVYAASVILYELLVGRRPFEGTNDFEILSGHVNRRPPPPRALQQDISVELQSIVLAGLAKDPAKRFQSAAAMHAALGHLQ